MLWLNCSASWIRCCSVWVTHGRCWITSYPKSTRATSTPPHLPWTAPSSKVAVALHWPLSSFVPFISTSNQPIHPSTIPQPSLNHPSTIPQPSILQMGKRNVHHPRGSFEGSWRRSWQESQPERSLEGFRQSLTNQSYKWAREMSISLERILRGIISKILTRILETIPSESLKDPWKDPVRIPKNSNDDMPIEPDRWLRTNNEAKPPLNWSMNTSWMNLTRVNQLTN